MPDDNQVPVKNFSLSIRETEKLALLKQHLDAIYSMEVSTIAADRLGYQVTQHTVFRLAEDLKSIQIWEKPTAINQQAPPMNPSTGGSAVI